MNPEFKKILENDPKYYGVVVNTTSLLTRIYFEFYICIAFIIIGFITNSKPFYILAFIVHLLFIFVMRSSIYKEKYNPFVIDVEVAVRNLLGVDLRKDNYTFDELRQKAIDHIQRLKENLETGLVVADRSSERDIIRFNYLKKVYFNDLYRLKYIGLIKDEDFLFEIDKIKVY